MAPIIHALVAFLSVLSMSQAQLAKAQAAAAPRGVANIDDTGDASCAIAIALFNGIGTNIILQHDEQASATAIQAFLNGTAASNQAVFANLKSNLLAVVNAGITVRQNNQQIAPAGNAAIPGLAVVATAQQTEKNLSSSLNGSPAHDLPVLSTLLTDFQGGISQNLLNQQAALQGC